MKLKLVTAFALSLAMAAVSFAGGYWLEFGTPTASSDPAAKGALILVRAIGCHEPAKSVMTANAEGLVNGERKTMKLEVAPTATLGIFAVKGKLPAEGTWVVAVTGAYNGVDATAVAKVNSAGFERSTAKYVRGKSSTAEVDALLR